MFPRVTLKTALCLFRSRELTLHCRIFLSHSKNTILLYVDMGIFLRTEASDRLACAFLTGVPLLSLTNLLVVSDLCLSFLAAIQVINCFFHSVPCKVVAWLDCHLEVQSRNKQSIDTTSKLFSSAETGHCWGLESTKWPNPLKICPKPVFKIQTLKCVPAKRCCDYNAMLIV